MSLQSRNLFSESAIVTPTGDEGAEGIQKSGQLDTSGANSGLGHSATGQADARCYKETRDALSGTIHQGQGADGAGISLPTDVDHFTTRGF